MGGLAGPGTIGGGGGGVTSFNTRTGAVVPAYGDYDYTQLTSPPIYEPVLAAPANSFIGVYNNGASGVGATITASANGVLSVDGVTPVVGDRIIFTRSILPIQNGIYTVTNTGSASTKYVLTRATDFDTPAKIIAGGQVFVRQGATYGGQIFTATGGVVTIGTTAINFGNIGYLPLAGGTVTGGVTLNGPFLDINGDTVFGPGTIVQSSTITFDDSTGNMTGGFSTTFTWGGWQIQSDNLFDSAGSIGCEFGSFTGGLGVGSGLSNLNTCDFAGGVAIGTYAFVNGAPSNGVIVSGPTGLGTANPINILDVAGGAVFGTYAGVNSAPSNGIAVSGNSGFGLSAANAFVDVGAGTTSQPPIHLTQGPVTTSIGNGNFEFDGNNLYITAFARQSIMTALFTGTSTQTVTNTTAETSAIPTSGIGTKTLASGALIVGKTIRISGAGVFSTALAPGNLTVKIKLGSTVLASAVITNILSNAANNAFEFDAMITCRTTGGTGAIMTNGTARYDTGTLVQGVAAMNNAGATVAVNTASSLVVDVTVTWATASASNSISTTTCNIEISN